MAPLDLAGELPDLADDAPAGPNLEFDADFAALERAAQGKPEQQYGATVIPAEQPNWQDVAARAAALLERTHDLRVLVHLATARLQLAGLPAFAAAIGMIRQQIEQAWDHVHPQLDPEDDNDPTARANALLRLTDPARVLRVLRAAPLAASRREGVVSWRTIGLATGAVQPEEGEETKHEMAIRAAFADTGAAEVSAKLATVKACVSDIAAISAAFDSHSGYGTGPDLSRLAKQLQEMAQYITQYMPTTDGPAEAKGGETSEPAAEAGGMAPPPRAGGVSVAALNSVSTRADALRLLDIVCRYYQQYEPSSPLPLLIGRARNLAEKGFLEILQDLAPDGLNQAQVIVQPRDS